MIFFIQFIVLIHVGYSAERMKQVHRETFLNTSCGMDRMPYQNVREGPANIESFPWLGILIYPYDSTFTSLTTVVLITKRFAIAAALDIDQYPKDDFRERSRVILGHNCTGPQIRVREYVFHPDFIKSTFSTLALLQLGSTKGTLNIFPICPPPNPAHLDDTTKVYAMTLINENCRNSTMVRIYKMMYVKTDQCREFYRRSELDMESLWPTHLACARGVTGGHCVWRSGTALVVRYKGRWRLLGLGTYGPGCESPSRFLDYGMYHPWVQRSVTKIGHPAVSRISPNHLILRRTTTNVQRFGECDPEEMKYEIFTDRIEIVPEYNIHLDQVGTMTYNVTLIENVEYQCIIMHVWNARNATGQPTIFLRRWCTNPTPICADFDTLSVVFYVQIVFRHDCVFKIAAYGHERKYIDTKEFLRYYNSKHVGYPDIRRTVLEDGVRDYWWSGSGPA